MILPKGKSIYIFGAEPQSGKSVVLLGIMELLSRHVLVSCVAVIEL
jgi:hypothetical protein